MLLPILWIIYSNFFFVTKLFLFNILFFSIYYFIDFYLLFSDAFNEQVLEARLQAIWDSLEEECQIVYGRRYLEDLYSSYKELIPKVPSDLSPVVCAVCNSLLSKNPRERYPCGQGADILSTLFAILPIRLADKVSKFMSVIPKNARPLVLEPSSHLVPWDNKQNFIFPLTKHALQKRKKMCKVLLGHFIENIFQRKKTMNPFFLNRYHVKKKPPHIFLIFFFF